MKKLILTVSLILFSFFQISCKQQSQDNPNKEIVSKEEVISSDDSDKTGVEQIDSDNTTLDAQMQLDRILLAYLEVKNALVAGDGKLANKKASEFVTIVSKTEVTKMTSEQQTLYEPLATKLLFDAEHINETQDLGHQRDHFTSLSDNMYALVKISKQETTTYLQHCPMANNGKGATWLSKEKVIKNPYYGSKMLSCGKIIETLE